MRRLVVDRSRRKLRVTVIAALVGLVAMVGWLADRLRADTLALGAERGARHHAAELNDNVVQGLALATYALRRGDVETAQRTLDATLGEAQRMIGELIGDVAVEPGDLRRGQPARVEAA